jgi:long-chain acyl-CoA synthetase
MSTQTTLDVTQVFTGKRLLFTGVTGFVGKVTLSMLLARYGRVLDQVYVLVRKGSSSSAERRFFDKVATSEPFQPLRDSLGEEGALEFLRGKCTVLDGDIADPRMGLSEQQVQQLTGQVHGLINCAGLVSFNPSLELSLNVNTYGVRYVAEEALRWGVPLVHMSTAFVSGSRTGMVFEDEEVLGYFPRRTELDGRDFSLEQELKDAERIVARLREQADDKALASIFRKRALERLTEEGRDTEDEKVVRLAVGRERKLWLTGELIRAGMDRAKHWGWPNTYTYSKSLGEQVLASTPGLRYSIVRPSVVESSCHFPFPGWNEGFTTSAPLCYAGLTGQGFVPAGHRSVLDMVPVDMVAGATLGITAHAMTVEERRVYHLTSGDTKPLFAARSVELTGLYRRRYYRRRDKGHALLNSLRARVEPQPVSRELFEAFSAPLLAKGTKLLSQALEQVRPTWGAPTMQALVDRARERLEDVQEEAQSLQGMVELFMPFLCNEGYIFRSDNTRSVYARMAPEDRARINWNPEALDWRTYFLETHLPGLEKWVFPGLEEEKERHKVIPAHRDLLEMLEACTHAWRHRVALRGMDGEHQERFTYGEVNRYACRVGSYLLSQGLKRGDRVLLLSENRPEWPISYFGILRAGATAVPVDRSLTEQEVLNIARRAEAKVCLLSEECARDLPGLFLSLTAEGVHVCSLGEAMSGDPAHPDGIGPVRRTAAPDDVASLIFTSGTTGNPKGVMLTHRNFTSLVAKLAGAFGVHVGDGVLSVLPLHHTFEFSAGFLTPFSCGTEITYLDELTSDRLNEAMQSGHITAMVGVPALWQLLHRKITQEIANRPPLVEQIIRTLLEAHGELRNRSSLNLGKLLFRPVHNRFGGRMRFLVSGGSALPDEVHKTFHELGFQLVEGYGLTEAAPVLTVSDARSNKRQVGTVGKALPGIEIRILEPDNDGIGEVIARGSNVMAGYFTDREATEAVIKDGWLHTGDLGRLDAEGRLYLVGRKKDVIIDANGKNVYPDELEDLYGQSPLLKELSIVGLPDDAGGEKVACLCVPDYGDRPREEVRRELEEHFRRTGADLAFYRRVKVLRFWDGELPRTSTRKVKRKLVVEELKRLERMAASAERVRERAQGGGGVGDWLFPLIAEVSNRPLSEVRPEADLSTDLGFDSLMLTELSSALEQAGVPLPTVEDLTQVQTVEDLRKLVASAGRRASVDPQAREIVREAGEGEELNLEVPEPLAAVGRQLVGLGQQAIFGSLFEVKVRGEQFIPQNRNFLVIANHASHLDMGLVKRVLGEQGTRLTALAARDYFFDTPLKRAWFENFTNLIPMDRQGSLRESLRLAGAAVRQGYNLLIFPEGTRSLTGELQEFKPTLGYLALTYEVDVLPVYLKGTYEALPKGTYFPKSRELEAYIGPVLSYEQLRERTRGLARSESYRYVTRMAEEAMRALAAGRVLDLGQGLSVPEPAEEQPPRRSTGGGEA